MKRAALKRGTTLKRGGTLKPKRKAKTSLAKHRANADKWCFLWYRGKPCIVCGTTNKTAGHHLIPKSRSLRHRHSTENIVPLCPKHHTMGSELAAHSQSFLVVARFADWMREHRPAQYQWVLDHEHDACEYKTADWEDIAQYWQDVVEKDAEYAWMMRQCGLNIGTNQ